MSIRHVLLALLEPEPMYGYQLRAEFESRTGATWPLNIGQVYTTLSRLERDGLVEAVGQDDEGRVVYRISPAGREEIRSWFATAVRRTTPPRDELAIKLAMAVTVPGVDVHALVEGQRATTIRALQHYTRLKGEAAELAADGELAWLLVVEWLIFAADAEARWLDHCEARLARAAAEQEDRDPVTGPISVSMRDGVRW